MNDETDFEAKTNVQNRLLEAIKRIEQREKSKNIDIPMPTYEENPKNSGFWYYK
jgi:hypothetical protein